MGILTPELFIALAAMIRAARETTDPAILKRMDTIGVEMLETFWRDIKAGRATLGIDKPGGGPG
jgi:hypothetical protein